jgi:sugar phosphate isomerase/epimerase
VKRYLQSCSLRHHYAHAPNFDVFAFLDRGAASGYEGVSININGPGYRQLSGTSDDPLRRVRERLDERGLACDLEISGTGRALLEEILGVRRPRRAGFTRSCATTAA